MAKYGKGILGPIGGRVGTVVGSSWKGIHYLRSLPSHVENPRTERQVDQRSKFRRYTQCAQALLPVARHGLKPLAHGRSEYNILTSRLFRAASVSALRLSSGVGPMVQGLRAARNNDQVRVTWTADTNKSKDHVHLAVVSSDCAAAVCGTFNQGLGEAELTIVADKTAELYAFAFRSDENNDNVSDTAVVKI